MTTISAAANADDMKVDHGKRRQIVTQLLIADILQGRLKGGEHLVINELARRYNVSPTPIREALISLEGIGLVVFSPNRGGVVRRLTRTDVAEMTQVRRVLECEATRAACGRIPPRDLHDLAAKLRGLQTAPRRSKSLAPQAQTLDNRLHDMIAEASGNRFLQQEISRLKLLFRAFRDAAWAQITTHDHFRHVEEAGEHLEIVNALAEEDSKKATRAMSRHIRSGMKYWSRVLPPT